MVAISLSLILLIDQATTLLSIELEHSSALIESKLNILKIKLEDPKKVIHKSLTDVLEAYLGVTNFKGEYRLAPLDGKLYAIKTTEEEVKPEPIKKYNIYGDEY